jgi:hypothetical protein
MNDIPGDLRSSRSDRKVFHQHEIDKSWGVNGRGISFADQWLDSVVRWDVRR